MARGGPAFGLNEEQGAQQHSVELRTVPGVPAPERGSDYLFEWGALSPGQRRGYAGVFKRGCFACEIKAPGKPLEAALRQFRPLVLPAACKAPHDAARHQGGCRGATSVLCALQLVI